VLQQFGQSGLSFIYSSDLVGPHLLVEQEPSATAPLLVVAEILAQHRLELMRIAPGRYAVVRKRSAPQKSTVRTDTPASDRPRELEEIIVATSRYAIGSGRGDLYGHRE
jgi:hypothetical protein